MASTSTGVESFTSSDPNYGKRPDITCSCATSSLCLIHGTASSYTPDQLSKAVLELVRNRLDSMDDESAEGFLDDIKSLADDRFYDRGSRSSNSSLNSAVAKCVEECGFVL